VDVEDSVGVRADEGRAEQAHEAGQADQGDVPGSELGDNGAIERLAACEGPVADDQRLDPGVSCPHQPLCVGAV
jgi:hypothetical protein